MVFSRSYVLIRLTRCKTGEVTNLVSRNVSKCTRLLRCASADTFKNNVTNNITKKCDLAGNESLDKTGYVERLTSDGGANINTNINSTASLPKVHNDLEPSKNTQFLGEYDYKFDDALEDIDDIIPEALDPCNEDLSHIGPNVTAIFNFAKFADQSHTIQQLVKLGVNLYQLERDRDVVEMFLSMDFEKDMKPYIQFLHDCGIEAENLGHFITRNPKIFKENMDDLYTRIRYLRAHNFTPDMIKRILNTHPPWLSYETRNIDTRLGYFQNTFALNGHKIRLLTTKCAKLVTYDMKCIRNSTFSVKEEMGFDKYEMQRILLASPRVWIRARTEVVKSFDYLHNQMQLSHSIITEQSQVLLCRKSRLERRHRFLIEVGKDQYDPTKPLYISPLSLVQGSDIDFCKNVAKANINTYNMFLKTL